MSCEEIRELFSDHVDGALSPEVEEALGRHLEGCRSCRAELTRYEACLGALAGLQPDPPGDLGERVARGLVAQTLLADRPAARVWLSLAAGLVLFATGLVVGRSTDRGGGGAEPDTSGRTLTWADACTGEPLELPPLDERALRAAPRTDAAPRLVTAGPYALSLPGWLTSHGPYRPDTSASVERGESTCLPLREPFGTRLALSLVPAKGADEKRARRFTVEVDPHRVLYARVLWSQEGLAWSLEGRAETTELLEIAREIAARVEVERILGPGSHT